MQGSPPRPKTAFAAAVAGRRRGLSAAIDVASAIWPARRVRIATIQAAAYDAAITTDEEAPASTRLNPDRYPIASNLTASTLKPRRLQ
jgi:hypothetical protein